MPKVYNKRDKDNPPDAVYIGRPTKWGNPFKIRDFGSREEVVREYRRLVENDPIFIDMIREELRGKDLVCWCAPKPCHGDILIEVANSEALEENDD